ncbi:MAG: IS66 family insertion sequence element accessory protein TnpB [Spirochaetales bacterium]|nr:IS66 family insertion sequence element accessory protein TnpB [Spirochaetales bacterium]
MSIYLRTKPTDMRKSINGLTALVQNNMKLNPFTRSYYVFHDKPGKPLR